MTQVSSFPHLPSIFQWKKLLWNSSPASLWNYSAAMHFSAFRETGVLFFLILGVQTLACTWHTNSVPYTGYQRWVQCPCDPTGYKNKGPAQAKRPGQSTEFTREKGAPHRPGSSTQPSTSLLISLIIVPAPKEECEKVKTSPTSKEEETAQKNLSTFKGLGDQ